MLRRLCLAMVVLHSLGLALATDFLRHLALGCDEDSRQACLGNLSHAHAAIVEPDRAALSDVYAWSSCTSLPGVQAQLGVPIIFLTALATGTRVFCQALPALAGLRPWAIRMLNTTMLYALFSYGDTVRDADTTQQVVLHAGAEADVDPLQGPSGVGLRANTPPLPCLFIAHLWRGRTVFLFFLGGGGLQAECVSHRPRSQHHCPVPAALH